MSWIEIDDRIAHHPKALKAGAEAMWLFVAGLTYCAEHRTDGFIPAEAIPTLTASSDPDGLVQRLLEATMPGGTYGLFEQAQGGYRVHDYAHRPRAEEQLQKEERDRLHLRAAREERNQQALSSTAPHASASAGSERVPKTPRSPSLAVAAPSDAARECADTPTASAPTRSALTAESVLHRLRAMPAPMCYLATPEYAARFADAREIGLTLEEIMAAIGSACLRLGLHAAASPKSRASLDALAYDVSSFLADQWAMPTGRR